MNRSVLKEKSKAFALRIIRMAEYIQSSKREFVLTKQILRSGTSIGANVHEAFFGQSLPDFISKLSIARKECGETQYWLELLNESGKISDEEFKSINEDCEEVGRLLTASIKTAIKTLNIRKKVESEPSVAHEPILVYDKKSDEKDDTEELLTHYSL